MTRAMTRIAAVCGTALLLATAAAPAGAAYLGYGNGDPGNWDLWTEQGASPPPAPQMMHHTHAKPVHHAHHRHIAPARAHEIKSS